MPGAPLTIVEREEIPCGLVDGKTATLMAERIGGTSPP